MSPSPDASWFSLLPEKRPPWKQFLLSSSLQAAGLLAMVVAGLLHPDVLVLNRQYRFIPLVEPHPYVSRELAHVRVRVRQNSTFVPKPTKAPVLALRRQARVKAGPPVEAPQLKLAASGFVFAPAAAVAPRLLVKTDSPGGGSSKSPTVAKPPRMVQTGGFGDPQGVPAKPGSKAPNLAQLGAFDLPSGDGKGNGSGGRTGAPGVIASTGFGAGIATGDAAGDAAGGSSRRGGVVTQAGFEAAAAAPASGTGSRSTPQDLVPAEILSKPNPLYTAEARKLRIEGEVLLQVIFQPSGTIEVLRVVRSLGHGLDEAAVDAAQHIRFRPATRDGRPTASTGVLHVVFQLA